MDVDDERTWKPCVSAEGVTLPTGYYLGFSAATGDLAGKYSGSGYVTVKGRHTSGVVYPILKGRQLRIYCSDSEWFFLTKRLSVTQITMARMAQIGRKWDLVTKT